MDRQYYVYLLASRRNGTLYTGMTSDLVKRVWQHKNNFVDGFTKTYQVKQLVYFEIHHHAEEAIKREKQIKKWYAEIENKFQDIRCNEYIIMPNHSHVIITNIGKAP